MTTKSVLKRGRSALARVSALGKLGRAYRSGDVFGRSLVAATNLPPQKPERLEQYFDGNTEGPGIWKWRHYFPIYEKHLARFVGQAPRLLEVGIYSGGSLPMWHEYFGDETEIVGVDIESDCRVYASDHTQILIGDQSDRAFLKEVAATPGGLDIIIDDGGHEAHQQIATFEELINHLRPGGVYLCEDVHGEDQAFHAYMAGLARNLHPTSGFAMDATRAQASIGSITIYPFVIVVEKAEVDRSRIEAPKHGTQWQPFYEPDHNHQPSGNLRASR